MNNNKHKITKKKNKKAHKNKKTRTIKPVINKPTITPINNILKEKVKKTTRKKVDLEGGGYINKSAVAKKK